MAWNLQNFKKLETTMQWSETIEKIVPEAVLINLISENLFLFTERKEVTLLLNSGFIDKIIQQYKLIAEEQLREKHQGIQGVGNFL